MNDYETYDGLGLAELVKRGEVTPQELLAEATQRADASASILNAIVTRMDATAHAAIAAGLPQGAFTGVPFLVKELVASVAGTATTASSRLYADNVAATDSE